MCESQKKNGVKRVENIAVGGEKEEKRNPMGSLKGTPKKYRAEPLLLNWGGGT